MKNFYFLCSMPRAGNTIISSVINNNIINISPNSIICEIIYLLQNLKKDSLFINFPDEKSLNNIINNVFNNYYKNWKAQIIIDRAPWGTPENLFYLKKIYKNPKFIIFYRPVLECLASFVKIFNPENVEEFSNKFMDKTNGTIGKNLWSIENIIKNKENYIVIHFKDFIKNPKKELSKIYKYTNNKFIKSNFKKIKQFSINNIKYNDDIFGVNIHKIRTNNISHSFYDYKKILPSKIINKYKNRDVL